MNNVIPLNFNRAKADSRPTSDLDEMIATASGTAAYVRSIPQFEISLKDHNPIFPIVHIIHNNAGESLSASRMAGSEEPSSTTTTSTCLYVCASAESIASQTYCLLLYVGMITLIKCLICDIHTTLFELPQHLSVPVETSLLIPPIPTPPCGAQNRTSA